MQADGSKQPGRDTDTLRQILAQSTLVSVRAAVGALPSPVAPLLVCALLLLSLPLRSHCPTASNDRSRCREPTNLLLTEVARMEPPPRSRRAHSRTTESHNGVPSPQQRAVVGPLCARAPPLDALSIHACLHTRVCHAFNFTDSAEASRGRDRRNPLCPAPPWLRQVPTSCWPSASCQYSFPL